MLTAAPGSAARCTLRSGPGRCSAGVGWCPPRSTARPLRPLPTAAAAAGGAAATAARTLGLPSSERTAILPAGASRLLPIPPPPRGGLLAEARNSTLLAFCPLSSSGPRRNLGLTWHRATVLGQRLKPQRSSENGEQVKGFRSSEERLFWLQTV